MRPLHAIAFDMRVYVAGQGAIDKEGFAFYCRMTPASAPMKVLCSNGFGWDHVSVSLKDRCPTWDEMEFVRSICFLPEETAMQLHVPDSDHISHHPYCLHLWRPQQGEIPRPPGWMVAPVALAGKKREDSG